MKLKCEICKETHCLTYMDIEFKFTHETNKTYHKTTICLTCMEKIGDFMQSMTKKELTH